ncbi:hypothetical protein N7537_012255 [Penicillium hordei]|uniref:Uncharacterized protein n=1 Tax=Penicillium hordei TaxID=40994 RepID=A0AAD6GUB4_9EURO|nr:uncharacterized protein N7537_012255 [Penicillium hordei]KAJ5589577.1 hypothetical protein N7537_012255 [Penicillium hordei]
MASFNIFQIGILASIASLSQTRPHPQQGSTPHMLRLVRELAITFDHERAVEITSDVAYASSGRMTSMQTVS